MKRGQRIIMVAVVIVVGFVAFALFQSRSRSHGASPSENEPQQQELATKADESAALSNAVSQPAVAVSSGESPSSEVLRLRGEVGVLRQEANELKASLAKAETKEPAVISSQPQQPSVSNEYPKTAEAATTGILQVLTQGDLEKFVANYGEPGVPKGLYDKLYNTDRVKAYFAQIDSVSTGQPTNSFAPNSWFVPYKIHFKDGTDKEMQLHVGQDPQSQKWYLKGGI